MKAVKIQKLPYPYFIHKSAHPAQIQLVTKALNKKIEYLSKTQSVSVYFQYQGKEINELRDRLDKVVEECEDGINRVINNYAEVDAEYAEKLLEGIRKTALGR